jgi:hypothetical protein
MSEGEGGVSQKLGCMISVETIDNIETKIALKPEDVMITPMEDFDNVW